MAEYGVSVRNAGLLHFAGSGMRLNTAAAQFAYRCNCDLWNTAIETPQAVL